MEILGIDVGGTGIKGAIVNTLEGELVTERYRIDTPDPASPENIISTVGEIVEHFNWKAPIGIGFPAAIKNDVVMTASNIDKSWIGLNAGEEIQSKTGCKTTLVNDVDAAGYAEIEFGAGKGNMGAVAMVAAGTGIGTALFNNGVLFPNTELGFLKVKGMVGEHYAAAIIRKKENLSWGEWGQRFNKYLKKIEMLFWPDLIILGGGVSKNFDKYKSCFTIKTPIVPAERRNNAGIIGASVAASRSIKNTK